MAEQVLKNFKVDENFETSIARANNLLDLRFSDTVRLCMAIGLSSLLLGPPIFPSGIDDEEKPKLVRKRLAAEVERLNKIVKFCGNTQ